MKNYYSILGVSTGATLDEIKSAFRRRAIELHPDHSGLESGPFQELQEAYRVLSDPERRRCYDERNRVTAVRRAPRGPSAEPLVRRRRGEPFNPFSMETQPAVRDVSLAESFDYFFEGIHEVLNGRNFLVSSVSTTRLESWQKEVKALFGHQSKMIIDAATTIGQYLEFMNRKSQGF